MKSLSRITIVFLATCCLSFSAVASDLVVVTSVENMESLDIDDVARIFLGKVNSFPSGEEVIPVDIDPTDPSFARFARLVLKKNPSQLRAYWAKRIFTGRGKPPQIIRTTEELKALVASDKRYLSYLDKSEADQTLRWVIEIKPDS